MPAAKMNIYPGIFTGNARGFGFVRIEGRESDIFIPPDRVGGAMNKDKVLIKITGESRDGKRAEGEVLRIIEKGSTPYIQAKQYDSYVLHYAAYNPRETPTKADVYVGDTLASSASVPFTAQELTL